MDADFLDQRREFLYCNPMRVEQVRNLVNAEPFRQFYMRMADGGRILVRHPDYIAISPTGRTMMVYISDKEGDWQIIDTALVTRLESGHSAAAKTK